MKQWMMLSLIALVLIGAYLWNRGHQQNQSGEQIPPVEEIITQEDGSIVKKTGDIIQEVSPEEATAKKTEIDEKLQNVEATELLPVAGQQSKGASMSVFQNGVYDQKIILQSLMALEKGYYYEAWLEKTDGSTLSIGRVEMTTNSTGQLYYETKEDKTGTKAIITKQMEGQKDMGEVVLRQ